MNPISDWALMVQNRVGLALRVKCLGQIWVGQAIRLHYYKMNIPIAITIGGRSHAATAAASTLLVLFLRGKVLGGCIGWPKINKNKKNKKQMNKNKQTNKNK